MHVNRLSLRVPTRMCRGCVVVCKKHGLLDCNMKWARPYTIRVMLKWCAHRLTRNSVGPKMCCMRAVSLLLLKDGVVQCVSQYTQEGFVHGMQFVWEACLADRMQTATALPAHVPCASMDQWMAARKDLLYFRWRARHAALGRAAPSWSCLALCWRMLLFPAHLEQPTKDWMEPCLQRVQSCSNVLCICFPHSLDAQSWHHCGFMSRMLSLSPNQTATPVHMGRDGCAACIGLPMHTRLACGPVGAGGMTGTTCAAIFLSRCARMPF